MSGRDAPDPKADQGPKYEINIEGTEYPWHQDTITVPQLRDLGHLPADAQVIEVDLKTNVERTLDETEVIEIRPGQGFGRKVSFKRG
jgi:hypothetical protein